MQKKQIFYAVILSIVLSLLGNVFFGRYLAAKISTIPFLNRWKIISPQAPIVINTKEEVRVSDTEDVLKTITQARSKLSNIVAVNGDQISLIGGAANVTSDGLFLTSKSVLTGNKPENLLIKLDDGSTVKVTQTYSDPATNLVLLKADVRNVPVANLGSSNALETGEKILFVTPQLQSFSEQFQSSFVSKSQDADFPAVLDSDLPRQAFEAQSTGALLAGETIINMKGEVVGLWDGSGIVSGDVVKDFVNNFLNNNSKISRPSFGLQFRDISGTESKTLNVPIGAKIIKIDAASPAQKAGLMEKDIITAVNGTVLKEDVRLEDFLQKFKPGDNVKLSVTRGNNKLDINITANELK